ncbi:1-acyl-sn-glycerol-3-phosphate acyltransferase 1, chloroplastic-like isoform X1 [Chenopodium quinoa]|uniref:1-acyl-sn-glycerol-3-phosphate acyltransferase 1, chloroplastic-like isoform X1 n=1 Tax=Chenopodium quinoa TaxID=63459 RepID=UPI000B78AAA2|nr:1-acyl-sn-glycerol-3-phosphate acyltransferase 1, chloroplastic-like isoform X1 [Chenopodium quinoa]XP_021752299.1 1-acyl-sn-glycerol-3-phosphate acyltransferase 1, chloroplastic-like isoform X1 [Chenopodium quinoa]
MMMAPPPAIIAHLPLAISPFGGRQALLGSCFFKRNSLHSDSFLKFGACEGHFLRLKRSMKLMVKNVADRISCLLALVIADGALCFQSKGAFSVAAKTQVPVAPMTIIGTGSIMPAGKEKMLNPGSVKVVIHPCLMGNDAQVLCNQARSVIADTLERQC